jgi:hypothetical protein
MGTQLAGAGFTTKHMLFKSRSLRGVQFVVNEGGDLISLANVVGVRHCRY